MNELQTVRSAAAVGAEIRALTQQFKYMTLVYGVEVGRRLTEAKEMLPYGEFGNWLKAETEFSSATASRFMKLHAEYGVLLEDNSEDVSTLKKVSVSNALRLLALPENEREEFAEEHDVEHMSTRELDKLLAERDEAIRRAEEAEKAAAEAEDARAEVEEISEKYERYMEAEEKRLADAVAPFEEKLAALKAENKELRERPVDIAVQIDEEAVKKAAEEAAEKADKKWTKKFADAEKQVKELESKVAEADKLREQLAAAEKKAEGASAPYEQEIATLKKQLAMSSAAVTTFKLRFDSWQHSFNTMLEALADVPDDSSEKLHAAVKAVLEGQVARV